MTLSIKHILLIISLFAGFAPLTATAKETHILLVEEKVKLLYANEARFSQVLVDAYAHLSYDPYWLGASLLNPEKQPLVDVQKDNILNKLKKLNTPASNYMAKQIATWDFAYRENIETDPSKVRVNPKFDPMINGNYWLSIPKRPQHIVLIDPSTQTSLKITVKPNSNLKDYLAELSSEHIYDSAWVIQANKDTYLATDIQWKNKRYFLSPGTIVFTGINSLSDKYSSLNADIANLLALRLEP